MVSLDEQKRALRKLVRDRMPKPGSDEFVSASVAAQERLLEFLAGASVVAVYRALPSECGTASLAASLEAAGKTVCYPAVIPGARELAFRRHAGVFVSGSLGIEEPTGAPVRLDSIDVMVVPAVAVDARGARLGRGKGHYDATLAAFPGSSIALVFESQLVQEVPVGEHDRPVKAICTEARLISL